MFHIFPGFFQRDGKCFETSAKYFEVWFICLETSAKCFEGALAPVPFSFNITDGLRAQYDGGPMPNAKFTYHYNTLFAATDPFALDMICHNILVKKREAMNVKGFNQHPRFTEYLRYAEKLELGIADPKKIEHIRA